MNNLSYSLGDKLTTSDFNKIVHLLRHNHILADILHLDIGLVNGLYGDYRFISDDSIKTITDNGILITQNLINAGLKISGTSPDGSLVEAVELTEEKFYLGVQYHPEFKSRPNKAHPLFVGFIGAALERSKHVN